MNCEKCAIKEECEKEKLAYFEGKRVTPCPLVNAARQVTGILKLIREEQAKLKKNGK